RLPAELHAEPFRDVEGLHQAGVEIEQSVPIQDAAAAVAEAVWAIRIAGDDESARIEPAIRRSGIEARIGDTVRPPVGDGRRAEHGPRVGHGDAEVMSGLQGGDTGDLPSTQDLVEES